MIDTEFISMLWEILPYFFAKFYKTVIICAVNDSIYRLKKNCFTKFKCVFVNIKFWQSLDC